MTNKKAKVDETKCIGCGTCASLCGECFEIKNGISHFKPNDCADCNLDEVVEACPVEAITVEEE